ncbi:MAG: hypothetical protein COT90_04265 [Candidatus Diapherotrites archaeon CG10_big_fil_rev_8_21_14_0_10_31_34]|nr:MAG: hypothetical protein COT90_04265 [Candidatus Diapherotrites archaeon CG10_big_fil_rev_8_21_14_0_10_31_34]
MLKTVTELMLHHQLVFEEGRINLFGMPISMVSPYFVVELQKELEKKNLDNLIYFVARNFGKHWFNSMGDSYGLKMKDVMKWGPNIISLAGWGKVTVRKKKDSEKSLFVTLEKSVNSEIYGKSSKAVDHLFRGLVCGAWSYVYGEDLDAIETKCRAKGDKICEFVIMPKKNFDLTNAEIKRQLLLPNL